MPVPENADPKTVVATTSTNITVVLRPYEPVAATLAWFDTLRAIEECINLATVDWGDDAFEHRLFGLSLCGLVDDPQPLLDVRTTLGHRFGENFVNRFTLLMLQGVAMRGAFAAHGLSEPAAGFASLGALIGYLQSRRRHLVALLHTMPSACQGMHVMHPRDTLNDFLPLIETQGLLLVGVQQARLVEAARHRLGLVPSQSTAWAMLDDLFLEPERARITEMPLTEASIARLASREPQPFDRLFSAAELRNDILAIEAAFDEYDLGETEFAAFARFVRHLSRTFIDRDFWIALTPADLEQSCDEFALSSRMRTALIPAPGDHAAHLDSYAPLVFVGGTWRSTVTLLSRFMYHWRGRCLDRSKRYQIRSGFIFEAAVGKALADQGFQVLEITRISRHEFDVVTLRDGVIWNVQCKNNMTDLTWVEADPLRFARYNRSLVLAYERALTKEHRREHVLTEHTGRQAIEHMVVSRFPVVTDNLRILPFSRIGDFAARARALRSTGADDPRAERRGER